jgi:hypothetical protein
VVFWSLSFLPDSLWTEKSERSFALWTLPLGGQFRSSGLYLTLLRVDCLSLWNMRPSSYRAGLCRISFLESHSLPLAQLSVSCFKSEEKNNVVPRWGQMKSHLGKTGKTWWHLLCFLSLGVFTHSWMKYSLSTCPVCQAVCNSHTNGTEASTLCGGILNPSCTSWILDQLLAFSVPRLPYLQSRWWHLLQSVVEKNLYKGFNMIADT